MTLCSPFPSHPTSYPSQDFGFFFIVRFLSPLASRAGDFICSAFVQGQGAGEELEGGRRVEVRAGSVCL